jgi:hypothetical protein
MLQQLQTFWNMFVLHQLDGSICCHPLVYALPPGDIELVALIALDYRSVRQWKSLGITPTFKGGLIIDHEAFPLNTLLQ